VKIRTEQLDWTDLQHFVALARERSLSGAARKLGVTHATVGRRVAMLEDSLGYPLFVRSPDGFVPTADGERIVTLVEAMEEKVRGISRAHAIAGTPIGGLVRITSTEMVGGQLLIPRLVSFLESNPELRIEFIADQRNLSLARRETDIAIRLARTSGPGVSTELVGQMRYRFYRRVGQRLRQREGQPLYIGYDGTVANLLEARYFESVVGPNAKLALATNNQTTRLGAVRAGLGIGMLPQYFADKDPLLERVDIRAPSFSRELWLMVHEDLAEVPRIAVCRAALKSIIVEARELLSGD
jgi:DNA-binding transcriptional LysR family regulator